MAIESLANTLQPLLDVPFVRQTRKNHALEHATIHILSRQGHALAGRSFAGGFYIMGDVPTDRLERAATEALRRMGKGEAQLAIHPNCGTNLVTTGLLTTLIAAIGFTGATRRSAWDRFPLVMLFMMVAVLYAQPLGMMLQKHITTSADVADMHIMQVTRRENRILGRPVVQHVVYTREG